LSSTGQGNCRQTDSASADLNARFHALIVLISLPTTHTDFVDYSKLHCEIGNNYGGHKHQAKFIVLRFRNINKKPAQAVSRLAGCMAG